MTNLRSRFVMALALIFGLMQTNNLFAPVDSQSKKTTEKKDTSTSKEATKEDLAKIKEETKGNIIVSEIVSILENITSKLATDINLGQIAKLLIKSSGSEKTDVEKYLEKIVIKTPVIRSVKNGLKLSGSISINNNPLEAFLEVSKDKDWNVIFYIKAPKKWKLQDYFPEFFDLKKIFPQIDKSLADKLTQGIFEFEEAYFYISTSELEKHPDCGAVVQGVGFKGKIKFVGLFDIFDKIFALNGEPVELEGKIKIPKFVGTEFSIKVPTSAPVIPESIKVQGKDVKLIPGFSIKLSPFEFSIKITDDIPVIKANGGITVKATTLLKDELDFRAGIDFSGTRIKLYGEQKNKITDTFGIKGLDLAGCKLGLTWDFVISGQLAAETAVIGGIGALLPAGVIIEGGLASGKKDDKKSSLDAKIDMSVHGTKGIDFTWNSKGTLYAKDFAEFWLDVIAKDAKNKDQFLKQVPPFEFEEVEIDGAWSTEDKKLNLKVGKVEMIPGYSAKMELKVSEKGVTGSGQISPLSLPNKNNPLFELTSKDKKTEGPSFEVDCTINPIKLSLKGDGRIFADLGPVLGKLDTGTKIDVSSDGGVGLDSKTKLLGYEASLKLNGKLDGKLDDWAASGGFEQKSTDEMSKLLKKSSEALLKASSDIAKNKDAMIKENDKVRDKALNDIENAKKKVNSDLDAYYNQEKTRTKNRISTLKTERTNWTKECGAKPWYESGWCILFQVNTRDIEIAALELYVVGTKFATDIAKSISNAALTVGQVFTQIGSDIKKGFETVANDIAGIFTKVAAEIAKIVDEVTTKVFKIDVLKFDGKVVDIKKGKLPKMEFEATILGKKEKGKIQLDVSDPNKFIDSLAEALLGDTLKKVKSMVSTAESDSKKKISGQEQTAKDKIKAGETEATTKAKK